MKRRALTSKLSDESEVVFETMKAAVFGMMAAFGSGAGYTKIMKPVRAKLHPERGYEALLQEISGIVARHKVITGDVIVVASKVFAIAQKRLVSSALLEKVGDPHRVAPKRMKQIVASLRRNTGLFVDAADVICSDSSNVSPGYYSLLPLDPNKIAAELSDAIFKNSKVRVDIIISDTDSGYRQGLEIIGCPTVGGTPIGSTKGLTMSVCLRATVAAEFIRGKDLGIPIVIARPTRRLLNRTGLGKHRGYIGRLDYSKEPGMHPPV